MLFYRFFSSFQIIGFKISSVKVLEVLYKQILFQTEEILPFL